MPEEPPREPAATHTRKDFEEMIWSAPVPQSIGDSGRWSSFRATWVVGTAPGCSEADLPWAQSGNGKSGKQQGVARRGGKGPRPCCWLKNSDSLSVRRFGPLLHQRERKRVIWPCPL